MIKPPNNKNIINGRMLAEKIFLKIKKKIKLKKIKACLAIILIGNNPASELYVRNKEKVCKQIGIIFKLIRFKENTKENTIIKKIYELNKNKKINGIIIQLPLPKSLNKKKIINTIFPSKDVDGLSDTNINALKKGDETLSSCTAKGIIKIIKEYKIKLKGKHIVLVGYGHLVGKPLGHMFKNRGIDFTICDNKTKNLNLETKKADIIITATGVPHLITEEHVKRNVIIIDAGTSLFNNKIVGDVDFNNVKKKALLITPVPRGVGPMTIAALIENTINAYELQKQGCILTVCKDNGAANSLSIFLKNWKIKKIKIHSLCIGQAVNVFKREGVKPTISRNKDINQPELKKILDKLKPKAILIGTSFNSKTERTCIMEARKRNIFCIGYIDWWANFGKRFSTPNTNDLKYLPDIICAPDKDAQLGCIADQIPKKLIYITGNPYWDYLKTQIKTKDTQKIRKIIRKKMGVSEKAVVITLFSSNIKKLNLNLGYDENDFWKAIAIILKKEKWIHWILKPHPSESKNKIKKMLKKNNVNNKKSINILNNYSAQEIIIASDFVIGMCSSTLFEAAILGKKVISIQPNMNIKTLKYLKIFDHLLIPKITNVNKINDAFYGLFNKGINYPNLKKIPQSLCNGNSSLTLTQLIISGMKKKNAHITTEPYII
jgi:methylenetetrahydrofolate dehydrogenase (NADP+)/methenyltetrahydrofolate cyclohydrolase